MNMEKTPKAPMLNKLGALKLLIPYVKKYRTGIAVSICCMLFGVVLSLGAGVGIRFVLDNIPKGYEEASQFLDKVFMFAILVIVIATAMSFISKFYITKISVKVSKDIRCDMFNKVLNHGVKYIESQSGGEIQTRIISDASKIGDFLAKQIPTLTISSLSLIGGLIGAFFISIKLTLSIMIIVPLIFLPFFIYGKKLTKLGQIIQSSISDVGRFAGEAFRNVKVLHSYNKEDVESDNFSKFAANVANYELAERKLSMAIGSAVSMFALTLLATLLWHTAKEINSGDMTIGQLVAFGYFAVGIVGSIGGVMGVVASINVAIGTSEKINEYLKLETESEPSLIESFNNFEIIEFRDVIFNYPGRPDVPILKGINFSIKSGSKIAIVGASGSGKSTIFDLLLKFYSPNKGGVFIDGVNLSEIKSSQVRSLIGVVPQNESLTTGSVIDNISYGTHDCDEQKAVAAAKIACADEFIMNLPEGYATDLGEVGAKLSGGQKQRISIARAIYVTPKLLLLDEHQSSLDSISERKVTQSIVDWANINDVTLMMITHRLTTVKKANLIIVMDDGHIKDIGTHSELLRRCSTYNKLAFVDDAEEVADVLAVE